MQLRGHLRIMPLSWVMALWKNMDGILSAKYFKTIEVKALKFKG